MACTLKNRFHFSNGRAGRTDQQGEGGHGVVHKALTSKFTEGLNVHHVRYCVCAFAVHIGKSVTRAGHYKALLYGAVDGKLHYCDDNAQAILLDDFHSVSCDVHVVFLARMH